MRTVVRPPLPQTAETVEVPVYGLCFGYLNKLGGGVSRNWKKKW
jgi:hypothetical protein